MSGVIEPITAPPGADELGSRLARVREAMEAQLLEYYVCFDPVNIYYLTHFANQVHERPFLLVIPRRDLPRMLAPFVEATHVRSRVRCELELVTYHEFPAPPGKGWDDCYRSLLAENARVGVEPAMPLRIAQATRGTLIVTDIIDEVRLVKTDYEIGRSVHACQVANLGHARLLDICRPGMAESELSGEVVPMMTAKTLADIPNYNPVVTKVSAAVWPPTISHDPNSVPPPSTRMEQGGPHVSIVLAQIDGYGVELERTFFLGAVPDHARRPFEVMFEARALAFEMTRPGANMSDIDRAVRRLIIERGYGDSLLHRTGHGLGITGHEAPFLAEGYERELVPGMLITIEPGIYLPGVGGWRHSDSVLVTEHGYLNLTEALERLDDLILPI